MREFTTAVEQAEKEVSDDKATEFTVDGNLCRAYKPGDGQLAVLMATTSHHSSNNEQLAGVLNFFVSTLDSESHTYVVQRLLNREDPFGISEVQAIMEGLVEEWTGNPIQSLSGSTPSPESTGLSSTPPTPALT